MTLEEENERLRDALVEIGEWAKAYPLKLFPEPDMFKAKYILSAHGMTVDAISASAMRHVLDGIEKLVGDALAGDEAASSKGRGS